MLAAAPSGAQSYYTVRLEDAKAAYVDAFGARGDGVADDTGAIQRAIDKVQETVGQGVVFVPEGRYRVTRTINVWPSIRLIGFGAHRPVFLLADSTPGYQDPNEENYLVFFAGSRPAAQAGAGRSGRPPDATPGTFYSAMSNIDIEIGAGNAGAVGVRGTYAQHSFLAHMDFRIGSGIAGVHDTGNVMEDVRFFGGQYGIWTRTPSPGWQFIVVDVVLRGAARGGHSRDGRRPDAGPPALPRRPDGHLHRRGAPGRTVGEGRAPGGHRRPGLRHQPGAERPHADQHGERRLPARPHLRVVPREREEGARARRDVRSESLLARPPLCGHRRGGRDEGRVRRRRARVDAGAGTHPTSCRCRPERPG